MKKTARSRSGSCDFVAVEREDQAGRRVLPRADAVVRALDQSKLTFHRHSTMGALLMSNIGELREAARCAGGVRVQHDVAAIANESVGGEPLAFGEPDRLPSSRQARAGLARGKRRRHRRCFHVRLRGRDTGQDGDDAQRARQSHGPRWLAAANAQGGLAQRRCGLDSAGSMEHRGRDDTAAGTSARIIDDSFRVPRIRR